jgi:site-specific DNA recombinase
VRNIPSTSDSTRAIAYLRVSTTRQAEEGKSLPAQRAKAEALCEAEGWTLIEVIEEARSGGDRDREGLASIFADLSRFDVLIIGKIDRFGRSFVHNVELKGKLDDAGVDLLALDTRMNYSTSVGKLVWANLSAVAQMERENIGERVAATSRQHRAAGKLQGGHETYGYRWVRDGHAGTEVVRDEAPVVLRWFTEYAAGGTANSIAVGLKEGGIRTRSGGLFKPQAISRYLTKAVYKGDVEYKGEVVAEDAHEAIVPRQLWDRVAALREQNRLKRGGGRGRPPKAGHLFTGGTLKCGECASSMHTRTYANGRGIYFCKGRDEFGKDYCSQGALDAATIDAAAADYFLNIAHDTEATRRQFEEVVALRLTEARALHSQAEGALSKLVAFASKVDADYASGDLGAASFERLSARVAGELPGAEEEAKRLGRRLAEVEAGAEVGDAEAELLAWLSDLRAAVAGEVKGAGSVEALRAALTRVFDGFRFVREPDSPMSLHEPQALRVAPGARLQPILGEAWAGNWDAPVVPRIVIERVGLDVPRKKELSPT